jgi:predicted nucleic acid-binding protein
MKTSDSIAIADTSAVYSLLSSDDSNHQKAVNVSGQLTDGSWVLVIPGDVLSETLNIVGKKLGRDKQLQLAATLSASPFTIAEADGAIRALALTKLSQEPAATSYTDCIVMAFADSWNTKLVFGFDEVFAKRGYKLPGSALAEAA